MQNEFINFKNKIFLVTGSNGFIGKNLCKKLRGLKATVIETDIRERKNNKFFIKADLNKEEDRKHLTIKIKKKFKKIDVLINNAGHIPERKVNYKNKFFNEDFIKLNLNSVAYLTESLIPLLRKSKKASIINIASIYGFLAHDYNLYKNTNMNPSLAYGISKAGLIQFTKLTAAKLAPNIRVNSISPGGIFRKQNKSFIKRYLNKTLLKRMGKEDDVSNVVIFLSSSLSNYITGQNIILDGGYSIS